MEKAARPIVLALVRVKELSEEIGKAHTELETWKQAPLTSMERTLIGLRMEKFLTNQRVWAEAIIDVLEEEE